MCFAGISLSQIRSLHLALPIGLNRTYAYTYHIRRCSYTNHNFKFKAFALSSERYANSFDIDAYMSLYNTSLLSGPFSDLFNNTELQYACRALREGVGEWCWQIHTTKCIKLLFINEQSIAITMLFFVCTRTQWNIHIRWIVAVSNDVVSETGFTNSRMIFNNTT